MQWPLSVGRINNSRSYLSVLARFLQFGTRSLIKWSVVVTAPTACHCNIHTDIDHRTIPASMRGCSWFVRPAQPFFWHLLVGLIFNAQSTATVMSGHNTRHQTTNPIRCLRYTLHYVGRGLGEMKLNEPDGSTGKADFLAVDGACKTVIWPTPGETMETVDSFTFSTNGTLISAYAIPYREDFPTECLVFRGGRIHETDYYAMHCYARDLRYGMFPYILKAVVTSVILQRVDMRSLTCATDNRFRCVQWRYASWRVMTFYICFWPKFLCSLKAVPLRRFASDVQYSFERRPYSRLKWKDSTGIPNVWKPCCLFMSNQTTSHDK